MSFFPFSTSGAGSYFGLVKRGASGQVWNGTAFEAWDSDDYGAYKIEAAQDGISRGWQCELPAGLPAGETLWFIPVQDNGGESADVQDDPRAFCVDPAGNVLMAVNVMEAAGVAIIWSDTQPTPINTIAAGGPIRLVQGGAFLAAAANAIDIAKPQSAVWPDDLSDFTTFRLTLTKSADNPNSVPAGGTDPAVFDGTVIVDSGPGQTVRFELTSAQTALLALGVGTRGYDWKLTCLSGTSDTIVLAEGQSSVTT